MRPDKHQLEAISRAWEDKTGYDSIATIERVYERRPSGAYVCVWPKCSFARKDSATLWRHVHTAHESGGLPPGAR